MNTKISEIRDIYLEALEKIYPYEDFYSQFILEDLRQLLMNVSDGSCQTFEARVARRAMKHAVYARLENGSS